MSETTVVAVVIVAGIFALMAVAIAKSGVEGAVKIWSLLGVAFGAIVSFYFTDRAKTREIEMVSAEASQEVAAARRQVAEVTARLDSVSSQAMVLAQKVGNSPASVTVGAMRKDPDVHRALEGAPTWLPAAEERQMDGAPEAPKRQ